MGKTLRGLSIVDNFKETKPNKTLEITWMKSKCNVTRNWASPRREHWEEARRTGEWKDYFLINIETNRILKKITKGEKNSNNTLCIICINTSIGSLSEPLPGRYVWDDYKVMHTLLERKWSWLFRQATPSKVDERRTRRKENSFLRK